MSRGILFVIVALVSGCAVYFWLTAPSRAPVSPGGLRTAPVATSATRSASMPVPSTMPAVPEDPAALSSSRPLDVPLSPEQRASADLEAQRLPFYADLRRETGTTFSQIEPSAADPKTLEIRAAISAEQVATTLGTTLQALNAQHYGFNRVVLYLPNPPSDFQAYRVDAEGTVDAHGTWTMYRK